MIQKKQQDQPVQTMAQLDFSMQSPAVQESLQKLEYQYGEYAASASEVRAMLDKAMGDRTLKEELHRLREE